MELTSESEIEIRRHEGVGVWTREGPLKRRRTMQKPTSYADYIKEWEDLLAPLVENSAEMP